MSPLNRTTLFTLVLVLAVAGLASAQAPGQMFGLITDQDTEEPLEGVLIVITDPESPDFRQEVRTDKRGRYQIRLTNAIVPYSFTMQKEGYVTVNLNKVKVPSKQRTRRNFTMRSEAAALASGEATVADVDAEEAARGNAIKIYNEGVKALDAGDTEIAKGLFETALERQADLGQAMAALARTHLDLEEYGEAVDWAEKAIAAGQEVEAMNQVLYSSYSALGDEEKAAAALAELQQADPEKASLNMYNEAADLFNAGQLAEAQAAFEKIVQTNPEHAKSHYMLGLCYVNSGNNAKAKEQFSKFLELAPNDPDAATAAEMVKYLE